MKNSLVFSSIVVVNLMLGGVLCGADPLDWPFWRGPEGNNISRETGLPDKWDPKGRPGSNLLWKRDDLGGRSTPIVMQGKLYTITRAEPETPREGEMVVCVDAATGKTIWENRFNVWSSDVPDTRVGWSSVIGDPETKRVYALGVCGYFLCMDADTGKTIWSRALHDEFGLLSTYGGRTNFPIICDDLVLISGVVVGWAEMARPTHRFIAFDKMNGDVVWFNGTRPLPEDTTFSTPALGIVNGQKAIVFGSGDGGLWAFQARTGAPIWQFRIAKRGMDSSPLIVGDVVYMTQSEENIEGTKMGTVLAVNAKGKGDITKSGEIWRVEEFTIGKASPVLVDGRLYCIDDSAKLQVFNAKTGEMIGREISLGTKGWSTPLYADGKFYLLETNGKWFVAAPDEKAGIKILARGRLEAGEECFASPIVSHGRLYIPSTFALYCLEDANKKKGATPLPALVPEPAVTDKKPAHVQVVPCELLMRPGESKQLKVKLFNAAGQFLSESPAKFELKGPGDVSAAGLYAAPKGKEHTATYVTAKVGELSGLARIRVVPPLPWSFDFEGLSDAPPTWVGARYRHVIRKVDGNNLMVKVTTIPKGTRSRCWFGQFDMQDYTMEADVRGSGASDKMPPDIGLIVQGYTFEMQGAHQKLQIRLWDPQLNRLDINKDFPWKPDTWYRTKFRVSNKDGKATLRAKVWPRDEKEPANWSVQGVDEYGNRSGAPGMFGNATKAEIFIDNIKVYSNE